MRRKSPRRKTKKLPRRMNCGRDPRKMSWDMSPDHSMKIVIPRMGTTSLMATYMSTSSMMAIEVKIEMMIKIEVEIEMMREIKGSKVKVRRRKLKSEPRNNPSPINNTEDRS
jgi:hypothetical protein